MLESWGYGVISMGLNILVNIFFACGVYLQAAALQRAKKQILFTYAFIWFVVTLVSGLFAVVAFWLIHMSKLSQNSDA